MSILVHRGLSPDDLPFSQAIAYLDNRDTRLEEDSAVVSRGFAGDK